MEVEAELSIVATEDRTVHPDLERFLAKRMGATTVEAKSSHVAMLSQPQLVLDVIRKAAKAAHGARQQRKVPLVSPARARRLNPLAR